MTNKQTKEYVSPTFEAVMEEIRQLAKEGYNITHGPEYSAGEYTVKFERHASEETKVVEVEVAPKPVEPAAEAKVEVKPQHKPTRGPKPKVKAPVEEPKA